MTRRMGKEYIDGHQATSTKALSNLRSEMDMERCDGLMEQPIKDNGSMERCVEREP